MTAKPPKIVVSTGRAVRPGYMIGRLPGAGNGPAQLLSAQRVASGYGLATKQQVAAAASATSTFTGIASENLAAGAFVNLWSNSGAMNVRNADKGTIGKEANAFVLLAFTTGQTVTAYGSGRINTACSGMTPGSREFLGSGGGTQETVNTTSPGLNQTLGKALSATQMLFQPGEPYEV